MTTQRLPGRLKSVVMLVLLLGTLTTSLASLTNHPALASPPPMVPSDSPFRVFLPLVARGGATTTIQGTDISTGLTGNEPTVTAVNPLNPNMVAVMRGCQMRISSDFGQTFPIVRNTTLGCSGDPSLGFDSQGRLFVTHLSRSFPNNELTVVAAQIADTTTVGTLNYTPTQVSVTDGNNDDKQWMAVDNNPTSPYRDNLYMVWTRFSSPSRVMFSRSTNQGATWSAPQVISAGGEGFVWPAHIAVALNGDVYVAYHTETCDGETDGAIPLLRDGFGGANFAAGTVPQKVNAFGAGAATITCNVQGSGDEMPNTDFWLQGSMQPWILPDPARAGHVYVIANDDPNDDYADGDDADVVIARSTDHGLTFTHGRVDHGPGQSFAVMPTAGIDQDGNIAVHWYDNRRNAMNNGANGNGTPNFLLDVYGTVSKDGGLTFSNDFRINDAPFDPDLGAPCRFGPQSDCGTVQGAVRTLRIGEYNGLAAVDGIGYAVWTGNTTTGQQTLFDVFSLLGAFPDRFEPNESRDFSVVAALGSDNTYNESRLTIHSPTDVDFFKLVALHTGQLAVEMHFNERINSLNMRARDRFGRIVATGALTTLQLGSSTRTLNIPSVQGQTYFVEVFDANAPNAFAPQSVYDLHAVNLAVPAPFQLALALGMDSGRSDLDSVTYVSTPTIRIRVDETKVAGLSFSPANGTATLVDDAPGYKVGVFRNGSQVGFATPLAGQPGVYEFTFPASAPLSEGFNSLTARVFIVDPADDPLSAGIAHVVGQGGESGALIVTLDTTPPATPAAPNLLASSDSGSSSSDNITKVNPPAFNGVGEANALVRVRANGLLVGQGVVGSDGTDGVLGNGLGAWEVTIEPLADGAYTMTVELEDLAGNISAQSPSMAPALVIDTPDGGGTPQRPTLDLVDTSDSGRSDQDNNTRYMTQTFRISAEAATTVVIKDGNTVIDTFVMPATPFTTRVLALSEGPHPLSTESTDLAGNSSHQSEQLLVTIDRTPPATPAAPDLLASSDTGGISIDNITTINAPTFGGTGEVNVLVRIYANGVLVGQGLMTSLGTYQISVEPLADGVYNMTVTYEDLAGNVSAPSSALKVTIAKNALTLPGETTGAANSTVVVDWNAGTVSGFPDVPGGVIGIVGIPVVNLNVNGQALSVLGSSGDDQISYTPNGAQSGAVVRGAQTINFTNVGGAFTIDPLAGNDNVIVNGTVSSDNITLNVTTNSTVQVNAFKLVSVVTANTEKLSVATGQSTDFISVTVYDTVSANVFVDAGEPSNVSHTQDELNVIDGVGNAQIKNLSAGPVPGSGSLTVAFPRTTNRETRIDYADVEKLRTFR